jgi:hypothetical protein
VNRKHGLLLALFVPAVFVGSALVGSGPSGAEHPPTAAPSTDACTVIETGIRLPGSLDESSGLAVGMRDPVVFWSQNDGGNDAEVIGFNRTGKKIARFDVDSRNRDWEAMDVGACAQGSCLYIADTGDNDERRDNIRLLRLAEPSTDVTAIDPTRFDLTLPDGPRDIEAMYVLPGEKVFFVTKGRNDPVTLYRYPGELREGSVVLEEVQNMGAPANPLEWVTGAAATRDGRHVAIRSYATLYLFRVLEDDRLELLPDGTVGLMALREAQGEAVGFGPDGLLYLTSERRNKRTAEMSVMRCELN